VMVRVCVPPVLRNMTGGRRELEAEGSTLQDLLSNLARTHPPLALHLFDEHGRIRRNILCIHDSTAVRPCDFGSHRIAEGDEVVITNALAGG
jgi:molybdopterin synthase sulfur carrier subunit